MAVRAHPDFDEMKQAIQQLSKKGKSFSAVCYRCTEPQFAGQIISGLGSQLQGARWTPKNLFPAVYCQVRGMNYTRLFGTPMKTAFLQCKL